MFAVSAKGEILERYVTKKRNKSAALAFMKKALKRHGRAKAIVTDGFKSYPAAMRELGNLDCREMGRWANSRAENGHLPFRRRECAMLRFRRIKTLQKFASVHAPAANRRTGVLDRPVRRLPAAAIPALVRKTAVASDDWQSF